MHQQFNINIYKTYIIGRHKSYNWLLWHNIIYLLSKLMAILWRSLAPEVSGEMTDPVTEQIIIVSKGGQAYF
jgi:hypothetical protein